MPCDAAEPRRHGSIVRPIPCDQIQVSDRHRQDMGDLKALADSISQEGLLQPIGITENDQLVFGERRLLAIRDILGLPTIEARTVDVSSFLAGEYAENEIRKAFTPAERVAITEALRSFDGKGRPEKSQNIGISTEEASRRAGFGNPETYRQAKKVVESAEPELAAAMDSGDLSISAAAVIADEPPEEQKRIVEMPKPERRQAVKKVRQKRMTEAQARKIAIATGKHTSDGRNFIAPITKEEEERIAQLEYRVMRLIDGVEHMADPGVEIPEMIRFMCRGVDRGLGHLGGMAFDHNLQKAVGWLNEFHKQWTSYAKDKQQPA